MFLAGVRRLLATAFLTITASTAMLMVSDDSLAQESSPPDGSVPLSALPTDPTTGSVPGDSVPDATTPGTLPLVPVPSACTAPPQPEIVFVGTLVRRDFRTGRFEIVQVRAGSEDPFRGRRSDRHPEYGLDIEYLDIGTDYLVSARRDPVIGLLASKIRAPAPLLGGDDVVGVAESDSNARASKIRSARSGRTARPSIRRSWRRSASTGHSSRRRS